MDVSGVSDTHAYRLWIVRRLYKNIPCAFGSDVIRGNVTATKWHVLFGSVLAFVSDRGHAAWDK